MAVGDTWYAPRLGLTVVDGQGWRQALRLVRAARPGELIVTQSRAAGVPLLLLLDAVRPRRGGHRPRIVLLEFIRARSTGWRRGWDWVLGVLLRRAVHRLHVLTAAAVALYESRYRLAPGTVVFAPWPL